MRLTETIKKIFLAIFTAIAAAVTFIFREKHDLNKHKKNIHFVPNEKNDDAKTSPIDVTDTHVSQLSEKRISEKRIDEKLPEIIIRFADRLRIKPIEKVVAKIVGQCVSEQFDVSTENPFKQTMLLASKYGIILDYDEETQIVISEIPLRRGIKKTALVVFWCSGGHAVIKALMKDHTAGSEENARKMLQKIRDEFFFAGK